MPYSRTQEKSMAQRTSIMQTMHTLTLKCYSLELAGEMIFLFCFV